MVVVIAHGTPSNLLGSLISHIIVKIHLIFAVGSSYLVPKFKRPILVDASEISCRIDVVRYDPSHLIADISSTLAF